MMFRLRLAFWFAAFVSGMGLTTIGDAAPDLEAFPLNARSGPKGATLFHRMPAGETGLVTENRYDDPRMWGERSRGFFYGPLGTGVAIGDYDNDGRPDILVVSKVEGHRLFRNLGDWHFADVTAISGVAAPADHEWEQGATWADVDNDGWLDLYVCRSGAPNLLYMNQRNGTFREEAAARGLAINDDSVMAAFCDYDRDGWLDVYLVTNTLDVNHDAGRPDFLLHNSRDGTFVDVTKPAGIGNYPFQGHAAIWWDYDNDGWPDLYVANDFAPPDFFYHNEKNGTFTVESNRVVPHTTNSSMGADVGDLNNDGWIDLFCTDMAPRTHEKEYRTMADARSRLNNPGVDPMTIVQLPRNALFLNTGTGICLEAAELAGLSKTDWTWSVRCEDLDCDGRLDLHFTNGMNREQNNVDLTKKIAATDNLPEQTRLMKASPVLAESNLAYRNLGDLRFADVSAAWGLDENGVSFGAAFADLDGDGDLDVVHTNYQSGLTALRNDADMGHRVTIKLNGKVSNRFGLGAIVRIETAGGIQVRPLLLARGYMSSSEPIAHFGLGTADHIDRAIVTWPSGHVQEFTNLEVDRRYVISEPASAPPVPPPSSLPGRRLPFTEISRYAGLSYLQREDVRADEHAQPLLMRVVNRAGPALAVGDLDGDGTDDLIVGGTTMDPPRFLIANREGEYHETAALSKFTNSEVNDGPMLIFDANGDGMNDVLITSGPSSGTIKAEVCQPRLLINQGNARFTEERAGSLPALPSGFGAAAAADFDRDGQLDVFLGGTSMPARYPVAGHSVLLRNRGGRFEDVTEAVASGLRSIGLVASALWTDVDHDGWVDLLLAVEWGTVRYLHNDQGQRFEDRSADAGFADAGTGLWRSLAAADFNGDGQPDYVVGNLGLNTPYRASAGRPLLLYRGIFQEGQPPLTVEAYYEDERIFPRSPRSELGAALPSVLKRFPRNNDYAHASLSEILGADRLVAATRYTVTELQSGVFLSQPSGRYHFEPLPRLAQIAPLQGIVAGDFDGDGYADMVAVQNDDTYRQNVGRFDGGLGQFLRGDGRGHFVPVTPAECGLMVPGDARALTIVDFDADGWPDLFLSRNRSPTLAWQNRGSTGHRTLEIRLHGPKGNANGIGGRVTVELTDGTAQTSDVLAGEGVLSQSTTHLFFGYPEENPPKRITVRWPNGVHSLTELTVVPRRTDLSAPAL